MPNQRATRLEIRLPVFRDNLSFFKRHIGAGVRLCLCLKANGYGHGLVPLAVAALPYIDSFSIACLSEGIALREAGIDKPILLLSPHGPEEIPDIAAYNLQPFISDSSLLSAYAKNGSDIALHLKIDTGMGRLGCSPEESVEIARRVKEYPNLRLEGLCTHFADSEEDTEGTKAQILKFDQASRLLAGQGLLPPIKHACNSAGALHFPEAHYNMVRIGSGAVGYVLSEYPHPNFPQIRFCASLKSKILFVKKVPAGAKISYGSTFTTKKAITIGIAPIGYADALPIGLSNKGSFLIDNAPVPIIGKICMDQTILDISRIPDALGKDVLIFGDHPTQNISRLVQGTGSTVSSLLTTIPPRVPRILLDS